MLGILPQATQLTLKLRRKHAIVSNWGSEIISDSSEIKKGKLHSDDVVVRDKLDGLLFGVLDGVSSWASLSIDPLDYPKQLSSK